MPSDGPFEADADIKTGVTLLLTKGLPAHLSSANLALHLKKDLRRHEDSVHADASAALLSCDDCHYTCHRKDHLKRHMKSHKNGKVGKVRRMY